MFGNEDHTNEIVLLTPITDNSGIMRALKVCFGNIKIKGRIGTFFLPTCMIYRYLLNHVTVVEIRCNFIFVFLLQRRRLWWIFVPFTRSLRSISVVSWYVSTCFLCYLHITFWHFRTVGKRYPMFLDYTSRCWASEFDKITSPQGRATGPRKTEVVRNFTSVCSLY